MDHGIGAIFDLDGTLVASEHLYFQATEEILAPLGRSLSELTPEEKSRIPGRAAHENMRFYCRKYGLPDAPDELSRRRIDNVCRLVETVGVDEVPGARDFLARLRAGGVRLAVASSSPSRYVRRVLDVTGMAPFFEAVRTGDDVTRYKPDPEIFLAALGDLGLPKARCGVVEDAHAGILAARAAGMRVLAVHADYTLPEQRALADRVVQDFVGLGVADWLALLGLPGPANPGTAEEG